MFYPFSPHHRLTNMLRSAKRPSSRNPDITICNENSAMLGTVLYGMVWYVMLCYGMVWYVMVCYGMVLYGMVWYCMVCCGMVWVPTICLFMSWCRNWTSDSQWASSSSSSSSSGPVMPAKEMLPTLLRTPSSWGKFPEQNLIKKISWQESPYFCQTKSGTMKRTHPCFLLDFRVPTSLQLNPQTLTKVLLRIAQQLYPLVQRLSRISFALWKIEF